jgi:uncharacterized damage-inducible protein DinB
MLSVMNPYASFLGDRDPLEVIAATSQKLTGIAADLGPEGLERSLATGKWSARAILCHLADCEVAFAFRLRQTLAEPHHVIQPLDQDIWARSYSSLEARTALEAFSALRRWNLALLGAVPREAWSKPVTHPERGQMTFEVLIQTMAGHDLNHLGQLERIASGSRAERVS